jgi:Zinc finger, ZZ type
VRFHCSKCEDFDICSYCLSNGAGNQHDPNHSFYPIDYRRLSLPPANGEDFALLQRFEQGTTSQPPYLHYPWLFSPDIFERLISGTPDEDKSHNILTQLEGSLNDVQLQVALDRIIRLLSPEDWNWREVQDHVKPVLELQLVRAEYSGLFYRIYLALKGQTDLVQSAQNANSADILALRKQLFDTDLDTASAKAFKDAMNTFLASRSNNGGDAMSMQADKVSESARYLEMLSKGFDVRAQLGSIVASLLILINTAQLTFTSHLSRSRNATEASETRLARS